jgi:hypothetical protein
MNSTNMSIPSTPSASQRAPRTSFPEITHAVLRSCDGGRVQGRLQVVSVTGGLLLLAKPLDPGCEVKVMFMTGKGSIFGTAEMLRPLSWIQQPFKFVKLHDDDQDRLKAAIQVSISQGHRDRGQMEKIRTW